MAPVASKKAFSQQVANMTLSTNATGIMSSHRINRESTTMTAMLRALAYGTALMLITIPASRAEDQTITVERGTPFPLMLETPFDTFLVDNPDVIDVHSRGDRSVIVEGIALGASNIVFIDERRIAIANIRILVCDMSTPRTGAQDETDRDHR
jgi:Flp pilus assembly secretin CpaC